MTDGTDVGNRPVIDAGEVEVADAALRARLEAMGVYDQDTTATSAYARILLLGPAKAGKTVSIATTAPKPLIINCDGESATVGARKLGGKFHVIDASTRATWRAACKTAAQLAEEGLIKTIVVDTVSLLSDNLLDEISITLTGWDQWKELAAKVIAGIKVLAKAPAHLFVLSHILPDYEGTAGILPAIGGSLKTRLPAILDDWIFLDVEPGRKPHERMFLLGQQKSWNHSGRNIKNPTQVPATVPALFEELGIKL